MLAGRAALAVAQERVDTALDRVNAMLTGVYSLRVQAAAAALAQAQTNVTQAESKITQAQTAVHQAQAQLDLIDVQMSKLVVTAAVSGVVLSRNIEPGEVVQAGAVALTLAQLDRLTITVYLPEDRYGEVDLGADCPGERGFLPRSDLPGDGGAHRRPGRIHPAQRRHRRRPPHHRLRHRAGSGRPRRAAQAGHARRCHLR